MKIGKLFKVHGELIFEMLIFVHTARHSPIEITEESETFDTFLHGNQNGRGLVTIVLILAVGHFPWNEGAPSDQVGVFHGENARVGHRQKRGCGHVSIFLCCARWGIQVLGQTARNDLVDVQIGACVAATKQQN